MSQRKSPEELSFNRASCLCDSKPDRVYKPRNGRLLLQCKAKKCPDVELSRELYFPDIACPYCSKPTLLLRSNKETNPGKLFYKCIPCGYFQWWHRSMQATSRASSSSSASSSMQASSSASSSSASLSASNKIAIVAKVLFDVGELLKDLSVD